MTEFNVNHIIPSLCHLQVSCKSLIGRCCSLGCCKSEIWLLIFKNCNLYFDLRCNSPFTNSCNIYFITYRCWFLYSSYYFLICSPITIIIPHIYFKLSTLSNFCHSLLILSFSLSVLLRDPQYFALVDINTQLFLNNYSLKSISICCNLPGVSAIIRIDQHWQINSI